ncbi:MAG: aldehyde dehydrogenase family protein [Kordiimonadaceae bacterium]|nr:aldehyde dehydrogenase family protein [Kordiimonadaceae bacterium]MBT6467247.1 aldehyde dehydrogenase family protein [Kordiimonadaceae bacterium]MBT7545099.1 aldehyde dehydrogenase family protein [Kordiimonadaceae bacterium]MDB4219566.1 aldehyde dehydrogenase family protein [Emcibacteraceae bacterium]MDC1429443.1 aldehyde dehydrogenase family protein [Emcibacteraceae bacterium]|tara:strand:+ start:30777 stop:32198 length:1422 start_codon:yes stop_codon:yes gene_type:complete
MQNNLKFYINGEWVNPTTPNQFDVINPATEEAFTQISLGSKEDVDKAVAAAKEAFPSYSKWSVEARADLLQRVLDLYKIRHDEIAKAISLEMGAPITMSKADQAAVGSSHFQSALDALKNFTFEKEDRGVILRHEPIGVCGLITPWNWPMNQVAVKVAPALAAGCTVVLKPSEIAPLDAMILAEILHEAGVPAGVFNLVNGNGPDVGEAMSSHPDIQMMSFTGSTRGGIAVARASADTVKRVSQELGGKSANIILRDADIAQAVFDGVIYCMDNSGQSCNAPTRMLVPNETMKIAIEAARRAAESLKIGDPADVSVDLGPVISDVQFNKIQGLIQKGIDEGATLVAGGIGLPDHLDKGYFVKVTVFANANNSMTIAREEIFGPVITLIGYDTEEEAINIANDTDYGLAGYVSSGDMDHAKDVANQIRAGQVIVNYVGGNSDTPFGGYKQSGNGREKGVWGLHDYLEIKAITGF